ncbi:hypothetical protein FE810_01965 [Thalassotalea litorea]|uniref:PEP-CTERM sorting domain-containing protein n=1 Tax=Thalassotalea litorea TaxID=2020715 RepID=A0A5R9IV83_9GAMM|nr:hypothetical protein [Thalassotalea litorea]TLU67076.1 hypothetical protein FE810_01965 [Thalassotalea litorea]
MKPITRSIVEKLLTASILIIALSTQSAFATLVSLDFDGNDCSGVFNPNSSNFEESYFLRSGVSVEQRGFDDCWIFAEDLPEELISPVIGKFEPPFSELDDSSNMFPSIDGDEWTIDGNMTGNWNYNPGEDDPSIRFWVAKAGNGFTLYWEVSPEDFEAFCSPQDQINTFDCMSAAQTVTEGEWDTGGKDLSHITFYDSGLPPSEKIPLGSSLPLFLLSISCIIGLHRFRPNNKY